MTRRTTLLLIVVVAALLVFGWYRHDSRRSDTPRVGNDPGIAASTATADDSSPQRERNANALATSTAVASRPSGLPSDADILKTLAENYVCTDCEEDDPFAAKSVEEAAWMQSRGFPTPEQLQHMDSLDRGTLRALADQGNLPSMGLYGKLLVQDGDLEEGLGYLNRAAQSGSIYALYALSEVKLYPEADVGMNQYVAAAQIRVAYLLGDNRAASYLYRTIPDLDIDKLDIIDQNASAYFFRLRQKQAQVTGTGLPPPIVPRPPAPPRERGGSAP